MNKIDFENILKNKEYSKLNILVKNYNEQSSGVVKLKLFDCDVFFKPKVKGTYSNLMEVFISKLLSQQFDFPRSEFGVLNGVEGSFSFSIAKDNFSIIDYDAFLKSHINSYVNYLPFAEKTSLNYLDDILKNGARTISVMQGSEKSFNNAKQIRQQFLERMIIANVFANTDDHAENHKLISNGISVELTNSFDNSNCLLGNMESSVIDKAIKEGNLTNVITENFKNIKTFATLDAKNDSSENANINLFKLKNKYPNFYNNTINKINKLNPQLVIDEMRKDNISNENFELLVESALNIRMQTIKQIDRLGFDSIKDDDKNIIEKTSFRTM